MDFFSTNISEDAIINVNNVLKSGFISAGKVADEFERKLGDKGLINPVTLNSGTITLFLALKVLGIKEGDEVIIPSQTFIATGLAVLHCGAKPVFADINPLNGNIDVDSVRSKMTDKTKAIIPVHWGGYPCDLDDLNDFDVPVIQDSAHALFSTYKGKDISNFSRFTSYSLQAIKLMTTSDGGILCCKDEKDFELVKKLRWFGIDRVNSKPSILGEREYDLTEIGYKSHMNDLMASIGVGNLLHVDKVIKKHKEISDLYREGLKNVDGIRLMEYKDDRTSSNWLFPILVEKRLDFISKLKSNGIPTSVVHLGIDKYTVFGGIDKSLVGQRYFDANQIHLPINNSLDLEDVQYVIEKIKEGW